MNQLDDLKILAVEARNHLYAVFKDTEVWQEAVQSMWLFVLHGGNSADRYRLGGLEKTRKVSKCEPKASDTGSARQA